MPGMACHDVRDGRHDALMVILPALRLATQPVYNLRSCSCGVYHMSKSSKQDAGICASHS